MSLKNCVWTLVAAFGFNATAHAVEITISCGAVGQERQLCEQAGQQWAQQTGNTVVVVDAPQSSTERYFQYLDELARNEDEVDVYQIDVIWPGLLAEHLIDLKEHVPGDELAKHFASIVENNTVDGRLVGMPWFTDVGMLYYREDLLQKHGFEVPQTWSELADVALYIQTQERKAGNDDIWGYVFQGHAYEGLTCNAWEWMHSYEGGSIIGDDGTIEVDNPLVVTAVSRAAAWVGSIAPPRITSFIEEDARITFQLGNAVFMRNWPYAWSLLNAADSPVAGKVAVSALPKGGPKGKPVGTLGGWQLGVSRYSKHPAEAAALVRHMTSEAVQRERAIKASMAPTIASLYSDPEVLAAQPILEKIGPMLDTAVARPTRVTGSQYMAVSALLSEAVHDVLRGKYTAGDSLAGLQDQLELLKARSGW